MADSLLDDVDRLAAALAGFRAAGLVDQPFEMAKLLVKQGWKLEPQPRRAELRPLPEMLKKWDAEQGDAS